MRKIIFVMVCTIMVASCATAPQVIAPFDTSTTFKASFDETWSELVRFMSTNQIGIDTIEKDSGLIVIDNENLSTQLLLEYCDAKATIPMMWSLIGGQVGGNVTVVSEGDFTTVSVNTTFRAVSQYCYKGCQTQVNRCNSHGKFESELLDAIK